MNRSDMEFVPETSRTDYGQQVPVNDFKSLDQSKVIRCSAPRANR